LQLSFDKFSTRTIWIVAIFLVGIITAVVVWSFLYTNSIGSYFKERQQNNPAINSGVGNSNQEKKAIVPLDQIVDGGPPRDGIPSIDNPKFVSIQDASKFLQGSELVLSLSINGDTRAYPLQILVWHEIVNDVVGNTPVAVTYCPLCFTSQVFVRDIEEQIVQFGTSGKLYNSNLVMYDRTSNSLWSQALGEGIVGKYAGKKLEKIPFELAYWDDWKKLYPDSKVLSIDTGFGRPYGTDPYGEYYTSSQLIFPVSYHDDRLGLKEVVIGVEHGNTFEAYKLQDLEDKGVINDEINGKAISLFSQYSFMVKAFDRSIDGQTLDFTYDLHTKKIKDRQTGSEWNFDGLAVDGQMQGKKLSRLPFDEGFWFSWVAFHPQTEVYSMG
jgi:hypothetical protein